jgi:hypothetical protein
MRHLKQKVEGNEILPIDETPFADPTVPAVFVAFPIFMGER